MRISDWSSDVCSSDLMGNRLYPIYTSNNPRALAGSLERPRRRGLRPCLAEQAFDLFCGEPVGLATELAADVGAAPDDRGPGLDRKSVVEGESVAVRVDLSVRRFIIKKKISMNY